MRRNPKPNAKQRQRVINYSPGFPIPDRGCRVQAGNGLADPGRIQTVTALLEQECGPDEAKQSGEIAVGS